MDNQSTLIRIAVVSILLGIVLGAAACQQAKKTAENVKPSPSQTPAVSGNSMSNAEKAVANAINILTNSPKSKGSSKCDELESELAGVERDQAGVEERLDATEDFGPQAGSPKKAIYMNALKRKGELQLQHIALERKLKACGSRK